MGTDINSAHLYLDRMTSSHAVGNLFAFALPRRAILTFLLCLGSALSFAQQGAVRSGAAATPQPAAEDWSRLAVDRKVVYPILPGVVLGKEERSTYTREIVRMEWRHGDFIDLQVVKPRSVARPHAVLYLYSYPSDISRFQDDGWCTRATRDGLAAVGFVSALTGDRFSNRPMREWFLSQLQESMGASAHDVQLILDYLASRGDLATDRVAMWGQGSGASIAILAAAADHRIAVLDLLNPWGDWPDWLKSSSAVPEEQRAQFLTAEFLEKAAPVDPVKFLPQLNDRTLRVQQILDDTDTPDAAREKIAAAVPPGHLMQYKDREAHRDAWKAAGIAGWIASQFQPPQPANAAAVNKPQQSNQ